MTPSQEFYAESVEVAVQKAAAHLGMAAGELSYEVVDEGAAGFLGIGARDARIVVDTAGIETTPPETSPEPLAGGAEVQRSTMSDDPSVALSEVVSDAQEPEREGDEDAPPEVLEEVERLVSEVVHAMGFDGRVDVYDAGDFIAADVAPDHTALFIGQKGETIDALQYLVNASVYRRRPFSKRVILDAEGYRQRRVEAIQGMAHRTARRALRERRTIELPPMNASERRVVHLFLRDNPKVTTASEGSGENRRVRVSPA
ncbi:MAG TPA: RNA-binding cell elongation regulator Jag/EloR [Rubrobacteraceae bacterium]|nr:RNA-binding cell elongation regulator Jag/EloR [Rubrobacteraceae bacterium]